MPGEAFYDRCAPFEPHFLALRNRHLEQLAQALLDASRLRLDLDRRPDRIPRWQVACRCYRNRFCIGPSLERCHREALAVRRQDDCIRVSKTQIFRRAVLRTEENDAIIKS